MYRAEQKEVLFILKHLAACAYAIVERAAAILRAGHHLQPRDVIVALLPFLAEYLRCRDKLSKECPERSMFTILSWFLVSILWLFLGRKAESVDNC